MNKMTDIAPSPPVRRDHFNAITQKAGIFCQPEFANLISSKESLTAPGMGRLFEASQYGLATGGCNDIFNLGTKQGDPGLSVRFLIQQCTGQEHFAKDTCCLRQG